MYTFLVYLYDIDYEINRVVVCKDRKELADLLLNIIDRYEINDIEVVEAELGEDYREFCSPKIN